MDEYVLDEGHWPEMPAMNRAFLERAILQFRADERLVGIAAGGLVYQPYARRTL